MIVVDAGAWVRSLVDDGPLGDAARGVLAADPDWAAPAHMPVEALRTLRRYEHAKLLSTEQADAFAAQVWSAEVRYTRPARPVLTAIWRHRYNISPYDAGYVAVAELYGAPLLTLDGRLARAAAELGVQTVVPDS